MVEPRPIRALAVSGSLRARSYNTALLKAAAELVPEGMRIERFAALGEMPHFNADLESSSLAPGVEEWQRALLEADALVVATPEYNASMSGVLKNAIDWASRGLPMPLSGLPVAVMGASPSATGSIRAQIHLRDCLASLGALVLPAPDVVVSQADQRFDQRLRLIDETTRAHVARALVRLADWTRLVGRSGAPKEAA